MRDDLQSIGFVTLSHFAYENFKKEASSRNVMTADVAAETVAAYLSGRNNFPVIKPLGVTPKTNMQIHLPPETHAIIAAAVRFFVAEEADENVCATDIVAQALEARFNPKDPSLKTFFARALNPQACQPVRPLPASRNYRL